MIILGYKGLFFYFYIFLSDIFWDVDADSPAYKSDLWGVSIEFVLLEDAWAFLFELTSLDFVWAFYYCFYFYTLTFFRGAPRIYSVDSSSIVTIIVSKEFFIFY